MSNHGVQEDVMTVEMTETGAEENSKMEMLAKIAAQVLVREYPDHLWMVGWHPGYVLCIKNMAIADGRFGFTIDAAKAATISLFEKAVIYGGGELLERCNVKRGKWDGEFMQLDPASIAEAMK